MESTCYDADSPLGKSFDHLGDSLRIVRLTVPSDLEALYRFRHHIYVDELGWLPPASDRLVRDDFDDDAFNYGAIHEGTVVGSVRIVVDSPLGLPLERYASLSGTRNGATLPVELCSLAVHPSLKTTSLGARLMKTSFLCAEMSGGTHVVLDTCVTDDTVRLYEKMGFARVGDEYTDNYHLGQMTSVVMSQPIRSMHDIWPSARPGLHRFFMAHDPEIVHEPSVEPLLPRGQV